MDIQNRLRPRGFLNDALSVAGFELEGAPAAVHQVPVLFADERRRLILDEELPQQLTLVKPAFARQLAGMLEHVGRNSQVMDGSIAHVGKFQRKTFIKASPAVHCAAFRTDGFIIHIFAQCMPCGPYIARRIRTWRNMPPRISDALRCETGFAAGDLDQAHLDNVPSPH